MDIYDLLAKYKNSPNGFCNIFKFVKDKDIVSEYTNILKPYYEIYGEKCFGEIFYNIEHGSSQRKCKICGNQTKFKSFKDGYKHYCSLKCSGKDASRISEEMRRIGTEKRKEKMRGLLDDPIRGAIYRDKISKKSHEFNSRPEERNRRSIMMKEKIKNGSFTPNSNNRNTHWESTYKGKVFRSSWEAMYMYLEPDSKYEELRIPYTLDDNIEHIYIIDFVNHKKAEVVEVKPKSQLLKENFLAKSKAAKEWCEKNNYKFVIADEDYFKRIGMPSSLEDFDENTRRKIENFYK